MPSRFGVHICTSSGLVYSCSNTCAHTISVVKPPNILSYLTFVCGGEIPVGWSDSKLTLKDRYVTDIRGKENLCEGSFV